VKWPSISFGAAAEIVMGQSPPGDTYNTEGEGLPFFQGKAEFGIDSPSPRKWCVAPVRIARPGDILLSVRAPVGPTNVANQGCCIGRGLAAIRARKGAAEQPYLRHFLRWAEPVLVRRGQGSTFEAVGRDDVSGLTLPLPALSEQRRIVELLDQADALRRQRAEADAKADRILPALFRKMFGDPATNPKRWPQDRLGTVLRGIDGGWSPVCESRPADFNEWGVLKLGSVTGNRYRDSEHKALPHDVEPRPELEVRAGDLLFSRKNTLDLVGACAFVRFTRRQLLLSDLIFRLLIRESSGIHPVYLWGLLTNSAKRRSVIALAGGSAGSMPNISKGRLESLLIERPPYEEQLQFASAFEKSEAARDLSRRCGERVGSLFAEMLRHAFSGTLTAAWREAHMKELLQEMEVQARYLAAPAEAAP
jgi:type I restriction enzyme S subunit